MACEDEDIDIKLAKLQQELMDTVVKREADDRDYGLLTSEIELLQERKQMLKVAKGEGAWRNGQMEEFKAYLAAREGKLLDRFDEDLFRMLIDTAIVRSMVEVEFVFKAGVAVREIL